MYGKTQEEIKEAEKQILGVVRDISILKNTILRVVSYEKLVILSYINSQMESNCQIFNPNVGLTGAFVNFPDTLPYNAVDFLPPPAKAKDPKTLNPYREEIDIQKTICFC